MLPELPQIFIISLRSRLLLVLQFVITAFIMSSQKVNIAEYLFTRLHQLGVKDLHGVPGDFNLIALDYVEPCGINWVGNCNELNAGGSGLSSLYGLLD
jgi:hypothetical protein